MENANDFGLVAATIDDACGECFDKVAKLLGFSYPGGPAIERQAAQGDPKRFPMPKMMEQKSQLHFSYSGLKTHVNYLLKKIAPLNQQDCRDVCASFQDEAFAQITRKLKLALQKFPKAKSVVIAGGVAANKAFQGMLAEHCDLTVYFPNLAYCSDNAAMIAACGWYQWQAQPDAAIYRSPYAWDAFSRYDFAGNTRHEIE
jgi:N6-L-threonylcarbamoyladenine synthase